MMKIGETLLNIYNTCMCRLRVAHAYVNAIENNMHRYKDGKYAIESMVVGSTLYRLATYCSRDTQVINIMAHENNEYPPFVKQEHFEGLEDTKIFTIYIPMEKYKKYTYFQKMNCIGKLYQMILHKEIKE